MVGSSDSLAYIWHVCSKTLCKTDTNYKITSLYIKLKMRTMTEIID